LQRGVGGEVRWRWKDPGWGGKGGRGERGGWMWWMEGERQGAKEGKREVGVKGAGWNAGGGEMRGSIKVEEEGSERG